MITNRPRGGEEVLAVTDGDGIIIRGGTAEIRIEIGIVEDGAAKAIDEFGRRLARMIAESAMETARRSVGDGKRLHTDGNPTDPAEVLRWLR